MATSKLFKKVPVVAPNRSGFNLSHNNFFTAPVGTLVPSLIDFLIPNDEVDLSSKLHVQLPPMATDFYGNITCKEEAFFVPARILFGGWKDFFVNPADGTTNPSNVEGQLAKYLIGAKVDSSIKTRFASNPTSDSTNISYIKFSTPGALVDVKQQVEKVYSHLFTFIDMLEDGDVYPFYADEGSSAFLAGSLSDYLGFKVSTDPENFANSIDFDFNKIDIIAWLRRRLTEFYEIFTESTSSSSQSFDSRDFGTIRVGINVIYSSNSSAYGYFTIFDLSADEVNEISINNILPYLAYHKVYDDWYRAPMIQQSLFKRNVANSSVSTSVANMPWITSGAEEKIFFTDDQLKFANGHSLFDLHQRNWQKDFFTSATPEPQAGEAASVRFEVDNNSGEFTIRSLRAANSIQQFLDRNNIGGFRYGDFSYAHYGVYPSDAITDRAIYLGSSSVEVYNKSVFQQSGDGGTDTNNPFNAIGSKYSNPMGVGDGSFCNNYRVTEAGFLIKIFSLVPTAYYSTGVRRMFSYNDISDIAFPVLAGVGDQPIYQRELTDNYNGEGNTDVFGYVQRYAEYKFIDDQVHGLLRDGQSLSSFALQRSFSTPPQLGSEFLQIPRDYLDQVSATKYKLSDYGCWVNCYNNYLKSSTLPAYSIPTLEDMKGHTIMIDKGGKYLD